MPFNHPRTGEPLSFDELLVEGELLQEDVFCQRAGITRLQLANDVASGRMFRVDAMGGSAYPAFMLDPTTDREQVESVLTVLQGLPGGAIWLFFTRPRGSLAVAGRMDGDALVEDGSPRTPLQALRDGKFELVYRAAQSMAEG